MGEVINFVYDELKKLVEDFEDGEHNQESANFLGQLISLHPSSEKEGYQALLARVQPEKQKLIPVTEAKTPRGNMRLRALEDLVEKYEASDGNERAAIILINILTSQRGSSQEPYRTLIKRVKRHSQRIHPALRGLPTSHYFSMTKSVSSIEHRFNEKDAQEILTIIKERIPADARYEHLALRVEYAIAANKQKTSVRKKTARQLEKERQSAGWREFAPRGLGTESTQRLTGGWRTVSGGLPNK